MGAQHFEIRSNLRFFSPQRQYDALIMMNFDKEEHIIMYSIAYQSFLQLVKGVGKVVPKICDT